MKIKNIIMFLCSAAVACTLYIHTDRLDVKTYAQEHSHDYFKTVISEPDCVNGGEYYFDCACGDSYFEYPEALGHAPSEWITDKEPTDEWGYKHKECTVCGYILEEEDIPPVLQNISQCSVNYISAYVYTSKEITPAVNVTLNGVKLTENTDYTVEYRNNKEIGTASIIVKGMGGFTGTVSRTFVITGPTVKAPAGFANSISAFCSR